VCSSDLIERIDPAEPIDRIDPVDPMLRIEPEACERVRVMRPS
jgi:hypothetical protein